MAGSGSASSAWAPLRTGAFRTLWIAALVSNVGEWIQTAGAHDAAALSDPQTDHYLATDVRE
jgi:hypothetical protein